MYSTIITECIGRIIVKIIMTSSIAPVSTKVLVVLVPSRKKNKEITGVGW